MRRVCEGRPCKALCQQGVGLRHGLSGSALLRIFGEMGLIVYVLMFRGSE